jgi:Homoserine acetyltransferase
VQALYTCNRDVSYAEIEATHGHDSFLMPIPQYVAVLGTYLQRVAEEIGL